MAGEYLVDHNPQAWLTVFGQELNPKSHDICKAEMLIKDQDPANITFGNTFSEDGHTRKKFDYMLFNPPIRATLKPIDPPFPPRFSSRVSLARCNFPLTSYRQ